MATATGMTMASMTACLAIIDAVKLYVANIRDGLIATDKDGEAIFRANAEKYLAELDKAKAEINAVLGQSRKDRLILTNHDASAISRANSA